MNNLYDGMTVNERLYVSGYMDAFDKAVKDGNVEKVVEILKAVGITEESTLNSILRAVGLIE